MKIRRILESDNGSIHFDKAMEAIRTKCSDYVSMLSSSDVTNPLLRGIGNQPAGISNIPIRTDRRPLNSKYESTGVFNVFAELKSGVKYIRQQSLFTTTSPTVAEQYGKIGLVFPLDGTHCAYNPRISDSLSIMMRPVKDILNAYYKSAPAQYNQYVDLAEKLKGAVAVEDVDSVLKAIIQEESIYSPELAGYKIYDNLNLTGIQSDTEISLFGAPSYYMVPVETVQQKFQKDTGSSTQLRIQDIVEYLIDEDYI